MSLIWAGKVADRPVKVRQEKVNDRASGVDRAATVLFGNFTISDFSEIKFRIYRKFPKLSLVITFAYELRFRRVTCPRTRIDELYNFREQSFPKFGTYQKANFNPYFIE